jgi:hypothetical protein
MISKSICLLPSEKKHYWAAAGNADFRKYSIISLSKIYWYINPVEIKYFEKLSK